MDDIALFFLMRPCPRKKVHIDGTRRARTLNRKDKNCIVRNQKNRGTRRDPEKKYSDTR
jgi:hypothetical protein